MNQAKELIDLIGNTPIIQVKRLDTGKCNLFLKLENTNPGYSIKDRVALNIINNAEKEGQLNKDSTIIEASAGNTALGLALIARIKGYKATAKKNTKKTIPKLLFEATLIFLLITIILIF